MKEIKNILKLENIKMIPQVKDWKEAIKVAVQPLVDGGYCQARYADEIIKNTEKLGPYYILCDGVALIHGSTDQGVLKRQIAITLLENPVQFSEDGVGVKIMITLAATDATSHMEVLQAMSVLFADEESTEKVLSVENEQELYDMFIDAVN